MTAGALQVVFHRYTAAALFKLFSTDIIYSRQQRRSSSCGCQCTRLPPFSGTQHAHPALGVASCPALPSSFPRKLPPTFIPFATAVDPPPFRHAAAHSPPCPLLFSCFTLPSSFITSETPHLKSVTRPPAHGAAKLCAVNFREADVLYRAKLLHVQLLGPLFAHTRRRRTHTKQVLFTALIRPGDGQGRRVAYSRIVAVLM